ncbi:MAG TPA: chromate transporter [Bacteroidia bacterium]|nr:chromate transporter [Bacteroidia bacterium]
MNDLKPSYSLYGLARYFLKLGTFGFGGPPALVSYMNRDLVEEKKWIREEDYKEGLALAQLAPGPLAAQLAIYLGYVDYRIVGATVAGLAFVLPSFIMVVLLGAAYVRFGGLPWVQAVFYGVGSAVIGIIAISSYKLTVKTIGKDWMLWVIFLALWLFTFILEEENLWLILGSGILYWFIKSRSQTPSAKTFLGPFFLAAAVTPSEKLWQIAVFFAKAGAFVFGSGLAIVPFLYGGIVKDYHWLNEHQFLDAVAIAMITPGPVVITVGFIGYLVAGFPGACVAALATFLPCYLFTVLPAPYFRKYGKHPGIKAFVSGITAAAVGAIAGAVCILTKRQLTDWITVAIAVVTVLLLLRFRKIQEPYLILAAALAGVMIKTILSR